MIHGCASSGTEPRFHRRWPRLARAAARIFQRGDIIVDLRGAENDALAPLEALPLARERIVWLHASALDGGDLTELPLSALVSRLGDRWKETIDLARGEDTAPLIAYQPSRTLAEETAWDELFSSPNRCSLHARSGPRAERLEGRGEARNIELFAPYESFEWLGRATFARKGSHSRSIYRPRLSHAPICSAFIGPARALPHWPLRWTGLCVSVALLTRASRSQLSLDEGKTQRCRSALDGGVPRPEDTAEIGAENVGCSSFLPCTGRKREPSSFPSRRLRSLPARVPIRPAVEAVSRKGRRQPRRAEGGQPKPTVPPARPKIAGRPLGIGEGISPLGFCPSQVPLPIFAGQKPMVSIDNQL